MKSKQKAELFSKTVAELKLELQKAKDDLLSLRLDHSQRKLKNMKTLSHKRKDIARLLTILQVKEAVHENA